MVTQRVHQFRVYYRSEIIEIDCNIQPHRDKHFNSFSLSLSSIRKTADDNAAHIQSCAHVVPPSTIERERERTTGRGRQRLQMFYDCGAVKDVRQQKRVFYSVRCRRVADRRPPLLALDRRCSTGNKVARHTGEKY